MNWKSILYDNLPAPLQNLAVSTYGLGWQRRRFGGLFEAHLQSFRQRDGWSESQFLDYQTMGLRKVLKHAFDTVPYYKKRWKEVGITTSKLEAFELQNLPQLPLLEKADLRTYCTSDLSSSSPQKHGQFFASSGSTGTPVKILFSHLMHQHWTAAVEARVRNWAGITRSHRRGTIGGRRVVPRGNAPAPYYRYNFIEKQVYFSAYHISPQTTRNYLQGMFDHKVEYMTGYASGNFLLARNIEIAGFEAPELKAVLTSSEKLTANMRAVFEKVYGCRTFDAWSGVEACSLVSECEHGSLHVSPDVGIMEFINPTTGSKARPGEPAEVVCTGLLNFDQPLVRYRIGDLMVYSERKCTCGRSMPVIDEIIGRQEDIIEGPDGRQMVRFHSIFIDLPSIQEAQVIQHHRSEFEIKVVCTASLDEKTKRILKQKMVSQLGPVQVEIVQVNQIPRAANGKFKAVISHLKDTLG
ncbi:MAG: phenylacetate--CoA ligase family protein [Saprospiraceae bacterium]|nr:phenylacetate--CoA ligase family protein [Saprospiraceae bacterium]